MTADCNSENWVSFISSWLRFGWCGWFAGLDENVWIQRGYRLLYEKELAEHPGGCQTIQTWSFATFIWLYNTIHANLLVMSAAMYTISQLQRSFQSGNRLAKDVSVAVKDAIAEDKRVDSFFSGLINLSLNITYEDPKKAGSHVFAMRTLEIATLDQFFMTPEARDSILKAKTLMRAMCSASDPIRVSSKNQQDQSSALGGTSSGDSGPAFGNLWNYPVILLPINEAKAMTLHIQNKVSSMFGSQHMARAVGLPSKDGVFLFALTWEWPDDGGDVEDKYRIMVIEKGTFDQIRDTDVSEMRMEVPGNPYYEERYRHLQKMARFERSLEGKYAADKFSGQGSPLAQDRDLQRRLQREAPDGLIGPGDGEVILTPSCIRVSTTPEQNPTSTQKVRWQIQRSRIIITLPIFSFRA